MCAIASIILAISTSLAGEIKPDEEVVFFNTWAMYRTDIATWRLELHGWIFEREPDSIARHIFLANLVDSMDLDDVLEGETKRIFEERAHWFLADNERGKAVRIRIGDQDWPVGVSATDGHFFGVVHLPVREAKPLIPATQACHRWVQYEAVMPENDTRRFRGATLLMDDVGLSVISDIDDTIKITGVDDYNTLLANTFLRPFKASPGMPELYRRLEAAGASFHYISQSPWQLYVVLTDFMAKAGYPKGTWALKRLSVKDEKLLDDKHRADSVKKPHIETLIRTFPRRRFILIGDSGQRDPEIYGDLARKYPQQIGLILIRHVSEGQVDDPRFPEAFKDLPANRWRVFRDPKELGSLREILPVVSTRPAMRPG